ncbi:MAG: hypothetical protein QM778_33790 [Myxococcales bacterium]
MAARPPKRTKRAVARRGSWAGWATLNLEPHWLSWAVLGCLCAAGLGRLGGMFWLGTVMEELGFQLCLVALGLGVYAALRRAWLALAVCVLLVISWGLPALSLARSTRPTPSSGPTLRVLGAHLGAATLTPAELLTELVSHKVNLAVLSANDGAALTSLRAEDTLRNYRVIHGPVPGSTWALFVRRELLEPAGPRRAKAPRSVAQLKINRCELSVQPLSVPSVFTYGVRDARSQRLRGLQKRTSDARSIWLGQLGSAPSTADVQAVTRAQDLRDGRVGYGRMPSTPASLGPLGLPHEHLLLRGWLRVTAMSMDEPLAPQAQRTLRATLELTEPACQAP